MQDIPLRYLDVTSTGLTRLQLQMSLFSYLSHRAGHNFYLDTVFISPDRV